MAKDVKCKVCSCKYHGAGDSCSATAVEVQTSSSSCTCSAETNCKTFMSK